MSDQFDTRIVSGGLPPLPAENRATGTAPRRLDPVRAARLRAELIRWSEAYLAAQLARAVARGRRSQ
jgi:hypothetical protein